MIDFYFYGTSYCITIEHRCVTHLYLWIINQQEWQQHFCHTHKTSKCYVQVQEYLLSFFFRSLNKYLSTFPLDLMHNS